MQKYLLIILVLCTCIGLHAQDLPRKGSLGVVIQPTEDNHGIYVQQVIPGGTGAALGLQDGDIILEVDGQPYNQVSALVNLTRNWKAGEALKMTIARDGKSESLRGKVVGKPLETSQYAQVIYGSVPYDGGQLRSILELPQGVNNPPVVFILPGIGCGSLDYYYNPKAPIKQFTEGLVKQGIAVYRVEKPGMGDSQNTLDCQEMGYNYEINAFTSALKVLKENPDINKEEVFLFGISLGGVTAPLVGAAESVKGIMIWGSVSTSWYEYSLRILRDQPIHQGEDFEEIEADFRVGQSFTYDLLINKHTPQQLAENPRYHNIVNEYFPNNGALYFGLHHYKFVQELNDVNLPHAWNKAATHVLALYGEYDLHAIDDRWAQHTAQMVNYYHPGKGDWMIIEDTEHGFSKVPSMEENVRMRRDGSLNGAYLAEHFNHKLVEAVGVWIQDILGS